MARQRTILSVTEREQAQCAMIVAEIAQAHDGSLGILHSLIDASAAAGVDAVKFQMHIAEAESSLAEPFRTKFSYVDATRYDYWKRMSFTPEQWEGIRQHCEEAGVEFLVTPFSNVAIDLLEKLGVHRYKVGSGDIANRLLLERLKKTGREVILSTGLGILDEIVGAVELLRPQGVAVLQCTTIYPTPPEKVDLGVMAELKQILGCPVGLSDHSGTIYPPLAAVALGAAVIEAHITFDRRMFGPDAKASLTVDEFAELVRGIRIVEMASGGTVRRGVSDELSDLKAMFGRTIALSRDLPVGHVLTFEDLEGKKPAGQGLSTEQLDAVVGRSLKTAKRAFEFLREDDLL